MKAGL
jgi:hypothetical protein